jgi:hypothetical protein
MDQVWQTSEQNTLLWAGWRFQKLVLVGYGVRVLHSWDDRELMTAEKGCCEQLLVVWEEGMHVFENGPAGY